MLKSREDLEKDEYQVLAPYAMKSAESEGRTYPENEDKTRTSFERDRDRIMHSKPFRRLAGKSQVVSAASSGDHYRTRITHTLEVAQIARGMARRLGLNEDLVEAIALGHDLGHTPHGHAGEDMLNEILVVLLMQPKTEQEKQELIKQKKGFEHNRQSLRIITELEKIHPDYMGLNPTIETQDGLMKHRSEYDHPGAGEKPKTLEALVVDFADEIAYIAHDTDDGLRKGRLKPEDLANFDLWKGAEALISTDYEPVLKVQPTVKKLISLMMNDVCIESDKKLSAFEDKLGRKIESNSDVRPHTDYLIAFSDEIKSKMKVFKKMLFDEFYMHDDIRIPHMQGKQRILDLFVSYLKHPERLPEEYRTMLDTDNDFKKLVIVIKDYIAGMSDQYAFDRWSEIPPQERNQLIDVLYEMPQLQKQEHQSA